MPPIIIESECAMKEKETKPKKSGSELPDNDEKLDINKSVFQVNRELQKQKQKELEEKQAELERQHAQREKEKRESYEKKLLEEKKELMRLKQGITEESEIIHEEAEETPKQTLIQKIKSFFYLNKWWLGLGTFFTLLAGFLIYDFATKPRPDMVILMICNNPTVGNSVYLEDYFENFAEDSNGNGKVLVSVYYIAYTDDEYTNYMNGTTNKLTTYLANADSVMIIGDEKLSQVLDPKESLVDLSELYPDNPNVEDYYFYLKDTDFAKHIGVAPGAVTDDMFFALRKPQGLMNASEATMQETYDKDFPVFEKIIEDLTK